MKSTPSTINQLGTQANDCSASVKAESRLSPLLTDYLPLYRCIAQRQSLSLAALAQVVGINRNHLSRIFALERNLSYNAHVALAAALDVDRCRAFLAVEVACDWTSYFDGAQHCAAAIATILPEAIRKQRRGDIEPLRDAAVLQLATRVAEIVARHDVALIARQNSLDADH